MKPLFIPLKAKYYDQFCAGEKDTEYRPFGPRWNEKTCFPGRPVVLSRGYGKQNRLYGHVESFKTALEPCDTPAWKEIYGSLAPAACIKIWLG